MPDGSFALMIHKKSALKVILEMAKTTGAVKLRREADAIARHGVTTARTGLCLGIRTIPTQTCEVITAGIQVEAEQEFGASRQILRLSGSVAIHSSHTGS